MRVALRGSGSARVRAPFPRAGGTAGGAGRGTTANFVTLPAPIGGWNARDPLTAMAPTDAIVLDNFIPDVGGLRLREGYAEHATDMGAPVESLMTYAPPSGTEKLFGATENDIWDVTSPGSASSVVTGLTNGRWQHTMFATTGGNYLVCANGADDVRNYEGTTWSTPSITGVTSANLNNVAVHASRLWFCENNTLDAWYLGTAAISGTATKLPLGPLCKLGGSLLAIASWTRDGGAGMDDVAVFITTKGEAVIYSGTDPSSSSTWSKIGTFRVPEPVGRRCVVQTGADLGLITSQGVLPFSTILPLAASGAAKVAATDKISGAVSKAYAGASGSFGWQLIEYPKGRLLILNVPVQERATQHQYVMSTQSGAWCRFTGLNAGCWALMKGKAYFGGNDGSIYRYGDVYSDDGDAINAVSIGAYSNLGTFNEKTVKMARPMFTGPEGYLPLIAARSNYDLGVVHYVASSVVSGGSFWDEAEWDVADWALSIVPSSRWQSVHAQGSVISMALAVAVSDQFQFNSMDLMVEQGGQI